MTDAELTEMLRSSANRVVTYAADRIEQLTAERDHAWAMVAKADTQVGQSLADHMQAKAERDRFRKLLTDIVDEYNDQVHGPILHSIVAARAELEPKP